jgi:hypothetical protein
MAIRLKSPKGPRGEVGTPDKSPEKQKDACDPVKNGKKTGDLNCVDLKVGRQRPGGGRRGRMWRLSHTRFSLLFART